MQVLGKKISKRSAFLVSALSVCATVQFAPSVLQSASSLAQAKPQLTARDLFYQELKDPSGSSNTLTAEGAAGGGGSGGAVKMAAAVGMEIKAPEWEGVTMLCAALPRKEGFREGDSIRFHVRAGVPCYAYVWTKGASGKEALLYPPEGTDNKIEPGKEFIVPQHGKIAFDKTPGKEVVAVLLTPNPLKTRSMSMPAAEAIDLRNLKSKQSMQIGNCSIFTGTTEPVNMGNRDFGDKNDPYFYIDNAKDPTQPLVFAIGLPHS